MDSREGLAEKVADLQLEVATQGLALTMIQGHVTEIIAITHAQNKLIKVLSEKLAISMGSPNLAEQIKNVEL